MFLGFGKARRPKDAFMEDALAFFATQAALLLAAGGHCGGSGAALSAERNKSEEELLKMEKLESLGILAGGIAHDFNNILTSIIGNISVAKLYSKKGDNIYERLDKAEKASLRARDLTLQLLTFSKGGSPVRKVVRIGDLVRESAGFALRGSGVRCELSVPDDIWPVEVDEGQISQVVQNLVINANQAMPKGGMIKIRAGNMTVSSHELPLAPGNYVKISFWDCGIGISPEHLVRIFDPYFTTKKGGSGLGLATTYSILKKHGGYIDVESKVNVGTTFHVYLPASASRPRRDAENVEVPRDCKGRIMVLDDDEMVRDAAVAMLGSIGYRVEPVADGAEAINEYRAAVENKTPFDLVIMDLTIPGGMGGKECIKKLLAIDPDVKAVVSSGYSDDPILSAYGQYGFRGVVTKPYRLEELSQTICRIINTK